ncbi:cyclin-T1-3-like isoform X2 [Magnolia sinica]|uniref:cyclin-T1-3-like isoform X2 n=1 Tax=Magnolia sinica TaxID=86752 RepID=UPI002659FF62|nr:cyclin-T1-3-like isoform X2 [Magnolia sinica]
MSFPGPRRDFRSSFRRNDRHGFSGNSRDCHHAAGAGVAPSLKRKRSLGCASYQQLDTITSVPSTSHCLYPVPMRPDLLPRYECEEPRIEGDVSFMSRDEIERLSPSRKDGIDSLRETHLRYSYCAFLQNLGMRLELPQTTIGTAMVLCHRFFVRRSHACHDRFLIATAALFLAAKSEETPCPLNTVLKASHEICHKQDLAFFPYLLPANWFEQYRERVIEAEQMILTTLNFELNVQHPYIPLTSVLSKLGLSQSALVNLAWNLVNEGVFRRNSVLTCMIPLAGGLISCSLKVLFAEVE